MTPRPTPGRAAPLDAMFEVIATAIPGCVEIRPQLHDDERGRFVKVFHRQAFAAHGLATDYAEEYYSVSRRGVIRGLHFQTPPMDHAKLVYCVAGAVQDVALDLRRGSPAYGEHAVVELSAERGNMLYLPAGLAHGFCTRSEMATMVYKVTSLHSPGHDCGILWNSASIAWAATEPIVSDRDRRHPALRDFATPFVFGQTGQRA